MVCDDAERGSLWAHTLAVRTRRACSVFWGVCLLVGSTCKVKSGGMVKWRKGVGSVYGCGPDRLKRVGVAFSEGW